MTFQMGRVSKNNNSEFTRTWAKYFSIRNGDILKFGTDYPFLLGKPLPFQSSFGHANAKQRHFFAKQKFQMLPQRIKLFFSYSYKGVSEGWEQLLSAISFILESIYFHYGMRHPYAFCILLLNFWCWGVGVCAHNYTRMCAQPCKNTKSNPRENSRRKSASDHY